MAVARRYPTGPAVPAPVARIHRRLFHLCAGVLFPSLLLVAPRGPVLGAAAALFAAALTTELVRFRYPAFNAWLCRLMHPLMKQHEVRPPFALTYGLLATALVIAVADATLAALALFFMGVGDPAAALAGERWGRRRIGHRTLEGSAAFFAAALAIGALVTVAASAPTFPVMTVGAAAAALAELAPLPLDDNLKVPLLSAGAMALASPFWA